MKIIFKFGWLFILMIFWISNAEAINDSLRSTSSTSHVIRRAAFDIGSSTFKLLVADYYLSTNTIIPLYSKAMRVSLGDDLTANVDGRFSDSIMDAAQKAIETLKNEAIEQGATEFSGIATAACRQALNGNELVERLNESLCSLQKNGKKILQIISQEYEGKIGFNAVVALYPEFSQNHLLAIDMGNSSIQFSSITNEGLKIYEINAGTSTFVKAFIEKVRHQEYTASIDCNPIQLDEIPALKTECLKLLPEVPLWLKEKLSNPETVFVGLAEFAVASRALKNEICTLEHLSESLPNYCNTYSSDPKLTSISIAPRTAVLRLIIIQALMETFGIPSIHYREALGSTPGIMISFELW